MVDTANQQTCLEELSRMKVSKKQPRNLPGALANPLRRLRGLIRKFVLLESLIYVGIVSLLGFWVIGLIDFMPVPLGAAESPQVVRGVVLGIFLFILIGMFVWHGLRRWMQPWSDSSLALLIERKYPQFRSSLVTAVDVSQRETDVDVGSSDMAAQAVQLAQKEIGQVDVHTILRWSRVRYQAICLGCLTVLSLLLFAIFPSWTIHWAKRFFALADQPWPRMTLIQFDGITLEIPQLEGELLPKTYMKKFQSQEVVVPRGKRGVLHVEADANRFVPEYCTVNYRLASGNSGRAKMRRLPSVVAGWQPFALEGPPFDAMNEDIRLSAWAGDMRLSGFKVSVVDGPLITAMDIVVQHPDYLRAIDDRSPDETLRYQSGLRIPQGSQVALVGYANKPLRQIDYVVLRTDQEAQGGLEIQSIAVNGDSFRIELGELTDNLRIEFRLWDQQELCSDRIPPYYLSVLKDTPPITDLIAKGVGTSVTPDAYIPLTATFEDDYRIRDRWLELRIDDQDQPNRPLASASDSGSTWTLDLRELREAERISIAVGNTVTITSAATDYFDLDGEAHVGRSKPISLSVISPDALLILLDRREIDMRARVEQIVVEMRQLRDLLERMAPNPSATGGRGSNRWPFTAIMQPPSEDDFVASETRDPAREQRVQQLRAQQSTMQGDKSFAELRGVEREIYQIRQELVHNRIDSVDRQQRLEQNVRAPIQQIVDNQFPKLVAGLRDLEARVASQTEVRDSLSNNLRATDAILSALEDVLKSMIDIQDFNEIIDMIRGMVDRQDDLLQRSKEEQKRQTLELFK